jgi:GNAT superfamily N-acetyltransferase
MTLSNQTLTFHPLTPDCWPDLEALFGPRGACAGCWDMWWRIKRSTFDAQKGDANREAFRQLVEAGSVPGLIAYADAQPIGWVAVQPRDAFPVLLRSNVLKPIDAEPDVWAITCFFVTRQHRRFGMTAALIRAALDHAAAHGARIIEAYPIEPRSSAAPDFYVFTGFATTFREAGFTEAARRSPARPIMRLAVS